jgi:hypothetical protein
MSVGQIVGGIGGAVIGFFAGGPAGAVYGAQIGMGVGGLIDPPKGPNILGPRLTDLTTQTSTYGAVIPRVYSTVPIMGNVFWLENNKLKETSTTKKQGKGGSGAEQTTFTYSATFAVGLCEGPITGVRRIWIGPKLVYDGSDSTLTNLIASSTVVPYFKIYNGDDHQLPDPRMQATLGVGGTPSYRGLAYIVFYDLELTNYQNSLVGAQVKVEVIAGGFVSGPTQTELITGTYSSPFYNTSFPARPYFLSPQLVRFYSPNWNSSYISPSSFSVYDSRLTPAVQNNLIIQDILSGDVPPNGNSDNPERYFADAKSTFLGLHLTDSRGYFIERGSIIAALGEGVLICISGGNTISIPSSATVVATDGTFVYTVGSTAATKYDTSLNVLSTQAVSITFGGINSRADCDNGYIWVFPDTGYNIPVYRIDTSLSDAQYVGNLPYCLASMPEYRVSGGMVIRAWGDTSAHKLNVEYIQLSSVSSSLIRLSDIITSECEKSNLLFASDLDVTDVENSVRGYKISSIAAIRSSFDPLMGAWPFDIVQDGYKIKFKPRGGVSVATIPLLDLDARSISSSPGVQITNSREMDSVLPQKVALQYFDFGREYNTGEQYAERLNTESVNVSSMNLAVVLTADEAAQMAEVLLYMYWLERYDVSFSLPPSYNRLQPTDVVTIVTPSASYELRLVQVNYISDGRLECQAKYNNSAVYSSSAAGGNSDSSGSTLSIEGPSNYELLDIPLLKDVFDTPGFPVAMAGYFLGWKSGMLIRSDDLGQTWNSIQGFTTPSATLGYAKNYLSAYSETMVDAASQLIVVVNKDLSSVTQLQMLNGSNHFAYGVDGRWEIIAAQNCVLQSDGSYTLSGLLRGRFGSEWATGMHAAFDHIVELDTSTLQFITDNVNTIGMQRSYRAVTSGSSISSDSDRLMTYKAVNLRCLSPVYLNGSINPTTQEWGLTWIRRTRKGGELRDSVDAPVSEASEAYSLDIFSDSSYSTVKRTLSSTVPSVTYTSSNQVTDFGSNQSTLYVKVYQLSEITGRGYPLTASISR